MELWFFDFWFCVKCSGVVMKGFENKYFDLFLDEKDKNNRVPIADIIERDIMNDKHINCYNLRSFTI